MTTTLLVYVTHDYPLSVHDAQKSTLLNYFAHKNNNFVALTAYLTHT